MIIYISIWIIWILIFILLLVSKCKSKYNMILPILFLFWLRQLLGIYDWDMKRTTWHQLNLGTFLFMQTMGQIMLQVMINFLMQSKMVKFFTTLITSVSLIIHNIIIHTQPDQSMYDNVNHNKVYANHILTILILHFCILFFQYLLEFA